MTNLIKKVTLLIFTFALITSVAYSQNDQKNEVTDPSVDSEKITEEKSMEPVGIKTADGMLYGKDYDVDIPVMNFGDLMQNAEKNNEQMIVVKGTVAEVCQSMGCWMTMSDGTTSVRATTSHGFFLPKDIAGQEAVIIGTFKFTEISEGQAKHYNEESKNPVDEASIVGPQKVYEIDAIGIKILNPVTDADRN